MKNFLRQTMRLLRNRDGAAAVEFAVGAPMMMFALITMTDIGLAINARMNLDQAVRSGAEFVMKDVSDEDTVKNLVIAAATGTYSDTPGDAESSQRPNVAVNKWCECTDNPGVTVTCTATLCSNDMPPSIYYKVAADKTYEAIILPDIALSTQINVQVR
ncbi:MAG: pilus assembly protein [Marinicaulis sp.]|nr:pilus assembly protein [Marinicaulis sp.]NNE41203.1 pilus assembly protein [Marinicaulis sp.]